MDEVWLDISGYEGIYQISNLGRVKSLERVVVGGNGGKRFLAEKILKVGSDRYGYQQIQLSNGGVRKCHRIHVLVASHFLGNDDPEKIEVHHKDHDKKNCHVSNLEWVTKSHNQKESARFYGRLVTKECLDCGKTYESIRSNISKYCSTKCRNNALITSCKPSKEELLKLVTSQTMISVGKKYGVSDNAVRKWCIEYGLPSSKKEIKAFLSPPVEPVLQRRRKQRHLWYRETLHLFT